jgi:hypothetical protein
VNWRAWHLALGAVLIWGLCFLTFSDLNPGFGSPYATAVIVPMMVIAGALPNNVVTFLVGMLPVPLLYVVWSLPLLRRPERVSRRTRIAAVGLVILSFPHFVLLWRHALETRGSGPHATALTLVNALAGVVLLALYRRNTKAPSYLSNFLFHWVLFAWLAWFAFPWFGELI